GGSGGGHMAHMMAAKYPDLWAGVSAWVSITNIATWHGENQGYAPGVEACTGGKPGDSPEVDWEYFRRSPVNFIANALNLAMDIHHGRDDKSVPYHHSVDSYNKLKEAGSTKATLDVFDGGHEFKVESAVEWLAKQVKDDTPPAHLDLTTDEAKSYYYATLVPAEEMKPGRCTIRIREDKEIDITADSLKGLRLDWGAMGVGAKEAHLNVRKVTNPMKLHVENIAIAEIECGKKIARTWEIDEQEKTLTIDVDPTVAPVTYVLKQ
ncbi:MAG: prolyl oligopeptidase family serine peptidase, partial [Planctomycetes bacterium]|nr:prolyl oligopeptidase family serine peptidase [Planctomycetota bacterium]